MNTPNSAAASAVTPTRARVPVGSATYNEVLEFLYDEAALLDNQRFDEWAELLAEDLSYTAPLRQTRTGAEKANTVVRTTKHFDDDYLSIMGRLGRLKTKSAWAEDPPSRTRRLITNVLVWQAGHPEELEATSYLLLARSRYENHEYQLLSAERHDCLRRAAGGGFKLTRREILLDQSTLGVPNLAVFL